MTKVISMALVGLLLAISFALFVDSAAQTLY
jgi:hypothetical protein